MLVRTLFYYKGIALILVDFSDLLIRMWGIICTFAAVFRDFNDE